MEILRQFIKRGTDWLLSHPRVKDGVKRAEENPKRTAWIMLAILGVVGTYTIFQSYRLATQERCRVENNIEVWNVQGAAKKRSNPAPNVFEFISVCHDYLSLSDSSLISDTTKLHELNEKLNNMMK